MTLSEFVYAVVLRPKPLKKAANAFIRRIVPERLTRHGAVIVLNPGDPVISGALTLGVYEKPETNLLRGLFRSGMIFVDIGANIGYYTALAMGPLGPQGRIVAIEPDTENFGYLQRTVAANSGSSVTCIQKAVADRTGSLELYVSRDNRGDNRLYANDLCDSSYSVEVSTLDALLQDCGIRNVDLIKMDVQGFEWHILRGMYETIHRSPNLAILSEFWPFGLESAGAGPLEFLRELEQADFELHELTGRGQLVKVTDHRELISRYPGRKYTNILAVRKSAVTALPARHA